MLITHISVTNYRGLRDVQLPLSTFGCLIGENNAGKSSTLQALTLFFSGTKLAATNFFDEALPIRIAVRFSSVSESDLRRLAPEHRDRVRSMCREETLTLVRHYNVDGKSTLLYNALMPLDRRFNSDDINALLKGGKPGPALVKKILVVFPELEGRIDASMGQDSIREKIEELAQDIPADQKCSADLPLKTGIDRSLYAMLPDPIYIPAVKDLSDDIKTTESTPFGKILSILLPAVEAKLPGMQDLFKLLNTQLNRVTQADGSVIDERIEEIKTIESSVAKYVNESFAHVSLRLEVPPPDMKTILSSTRIYANDGVDGLIDTKGDGLRRAIVFSILRSYVELKTRNSTSVEEQKEQPLVANPVEEQVIKEISPPSYILMFEEPELFLHPKAQTILFDALRIFAKEHQVLVTTHSPMFLGPNATETFIKLKKVFAPEVAPKPFTSAIAVDVSDMGAKDQFQIICFENNNAAFFANTVVLVEGDSDYLLLPHIAKTLNEKWDVARTPVLFVRITGKGNIRRYRDFFRRFDVAVPVIVDLDFLVQGFTHITPTKEMHEVRNRLLQRVDELISANGGEVTGREVKNAQNSGELRGLWVQVKNLSKAYQDGTAKLEELNEAVGRFYCWQKKSDRNEILMNTSDETVIGLKHELFELLRQADVYVLERGAIEEYYPNSIIGPDKPSKAQDFLTKMTTAELVLECCGNQTFMRNGVEVTKKEFNLIFEPIFAGSRIH